jgi:phenylpyruvate tautomerase PptA (4-oxalocrotonate tautomerase family)
MLNSLSSVVALHQAVNSIAAAIEAKKLKLAKGIADVCVTLTSTNKTGVTQIDEFIIEICPMKDGSWNVESFEHKIREVAEDGTGISSNEEDL